MDYLSLAMAVFADELYNYLVELDANIERVDQDAPFALLHDRSRNLFIQAIPIEVYNESSRTPESFRSQSAAFSERGQQLVHCWEDQWLTRKKILKSRFESLFGKSSPLHGRKCKVGQPSAEEMNEFLENNHLLGPARGRYRFGLYRESRLVAVALFARSVPVQRNGSTFKSHEMIRFCSRCGYYVQGGLSRLIKAFIREADPDDIYTSADRDWSDGDGFQQLGFEVIGFSEAMRFWLDESYHRLRNKPESDAPEVANSGNIQLLLKLKHD